jgi:hydroxyacylglutathione hydrolase
MKMSDENIKIIKLVFVNSYLIKAGDGFILIDTGLGAFFEKLETELINSGCLPDKLKLVIITHGDQDHSGNCAKLKEKYNLKIAIHKADFSIVETGISPKREIRTFAGKIMMFFADIQSRKKKFETFKPDIFLDDGDNLALYGLDAKVYHLPGHTKGSIGILTKDGDFFSGDILSLNNRKKAVISLFVENLEEIKKSVEKIRAMNIRKFYPGHGNTFEMKDLTNSI